MESINTRIKKAREAAGLSRRTLAHRLMIPVYQLEAIEEKDMELSATLLEMLCAEMQASLEYIMTGYGPVLEATAEEDEDEPPQDNAQAFYREHRLLENMFSSAEEARSGKKLLGYGIPLDSETALSTYMAALDGTCLNRNEFMELWDRINYTQYDTQKVYYIYGMMDGIRMMLDASAENRDERQRTAMLGVLDRACTQERQKGPHRAL